MKCFRRDVAEGAGGVGLHLRCPHGTDEIELRGYLLRGLRTVLPHEEVGIDVEVRGESLEHGGVLDVAVAVDHVGPTRAGQVHATLFEEVGDLRVGRFRSGLGLGNVHQKPEPLGEIDCCDLALVFGHDH